MLKEGRQTVGTSVQELDHSLQEIDMVAAHNSKISPRPGNFTSRVLILEGK